MMQALILKDNSSDVESIKIKEQAIQQLCDLYVKQLNATALRDLLSLLRGFFVNIPKAKTAKLVRSIIDSITKIPGSTQLQASRGEAGRPPSCSHACAHVCVCVTWCTRSWGEEGG